MAKNVDFNYTASDKTGPANESVRREMKKTGDQAGKDLGTGTAKGLLAGIKDSLPKTGPLLGTLGAIASPVIAAALSAGIIAGVSGAAIGGGVLLAARDPAVQQAGSELGRTLLAGLEESAEPFVQPVLAQIDKIEARFDRLRPRFDRIFANSAGFLDPLVDGILDGVDGITRGVDKLVGRAGPVVEGLGESFSILGDDVGRSLDIISGGSEDAGNALVDLSHVLGETLVAVSYVVRGLTELYGVISFVPSKIIELERAVGALPEQGQFAAHTIEDVADNTFLLGLKAQGAQGPIVGLSEQINGMADSARNLFGATTAVGEAIDRASEAAKKNGKTLDENTEKGRANRTVLSQLADNLIAQYNAFVAVNGEGEKSNGVANRNREAFIKAAGAFTKSKEEAGRLATQLGLIPAQKSVRFDSNAPSVKRDVANLQAAINSLRGKTVPVRVTVSGHGELLYGSGGGRQASNYAEAPGLAVRSEGAPTSRTAPPTPVNVRNDVNVYLDGQPFYEVATRVSDARTARATWRQNVGKH